MSYWRTFYHLIWSTKNREALITLDIEPRLFAYCVRKANELETMVHAINGWHDHVHMIVSVPPKVAIADLLHLIKGASSHFSLYASYPLREAGVMYDVTPESYF